MRKYNNNVLCNAYGSYNFTATMPLIMYGKFKFLGIYFIIIMPSLFVGLVYNEKPYTNTLGKLLHFITTSFTPRVTLHDCYHIQF